MPAAPSFFGSMTIEPADQIPLMELIGYLLDCRPELIVAANRLVDAEGRGNVADVVVDTCIGLETLLLRDNQELTFRVKLNYAFLGPAQERRTRADALTKLYSTRGKVVHGSIKLEKDSRVRASVSASPSWSQPMPMSLLVDLAG